MCPVIILKSASPPHSVNRPLGAMLAPAFLFLAAVAIATGWFWSSRPDQQTSEIKREFEPGNPLEHPSRTSGAFARRDIVVIFFTRFDKFLAFLQLGSMDHGLDRKILIRNDLHAKYSRIRS